MLGLKRGEIGGENLKKELKKGFLSNSSHYTAVAASVHNNQIKIIISKIQK